MIVNYYTYNKHTIGCLNLDITSYVRKFRISIGILIGRMCGRDSRTGTMNTARPMNEFQKSNLFYQIILNIYLVRQVKPFVNFTKCSSCNKYVKRIKRVIIDGICKCYCYAYRWQDYTLINTYYNSKTSYMDDYKRDIAFHLDILENNIYNGRNIFGEFGYKRIIDNLNFEKRFLYRYRDELRKKTSIMFWGIFAINRVENEFYLPTELIIEIIYQNMYWIPKINY